MEASMNLCKGCGARVDVEPFKDCCQVWILGKEAENQAWAAWRSAPEQDKERVWKAVEAARRAREANLTAYDRH